MPVIQPQFASRTIRTILTRDPVAVLNFHTGFNIDLTTGNYLPQMPTFRPGVDYGASNRLYQPEPGPPAYVPDRRRDLLQNSYCS